MQPVQMTKIIANRTVSSLRNGNVADGNHTINEGESLQAQWSHVNAAFQEQTLPPALAEIFSGETANSFTATAYIEALQNTHRNVSRMVFHRNSSNNTNPKTAAEITLEPPALYEASTERITFNPGTKANINYYPAT